MSKTTVGSQSIVFKAKHVAETKEAINKQVGETDHNREREETGTTPEKENQVMKTPKAAAKNTAGNKSKLLKPGQIGGEVRGGRPSASSL